MKAGFTEVKAEIKAQNSRIDVLQRVIWAADRSARHHRRLRPALQRGQVEEFPVPIPHQKAIQTLH